MKSLILPVSFLLVITAIFIMNLSAQTVTPPVAATATVKAPETIKDEDKVPAYVLPDPLVCADGTPVTSKAIWLNQRRPELLRLFENEVYGKTLLSKPDTLKFVVREEKKDAHGGKATRLRVGVLFEGRDDGRQMELLVYLPNAAKGPAPVFTGLNFGGNFTTTDETDIPLPQHWLPGRPGQTSANTPAETARGSQKQQWQYDLALERGYAVVTACYHQVEPDETGHWQEGPRGLAAQPGPGDWGSIGAWAWALSRAMDYIQSEARLDGSKVALLGFSRLGKAAVWAGAQDQRFALVVSLESGAGGIALSKRIFGETVQNLTTRFPHWFCPNFARYANNEAQLPVDQHELAALIAPRPLLVISATEDLWADPKGEFLSAFAADPVYRLLTGEGITQKEWPQPDKLLLGRIGYRMHTGKHDVTEQDWQAMLQFADYHFGRGVRVAQ